MSLKAKAAAVDLSNLSKPPQQPDDPAPTLADAPDAGSVEVAAPPAPAPVSAGRRSGVAAIQQSIGVHLRVQELEAENAELREASVVVKLDPSRVRDSKWKNRHELSFSTKEFLDLKTEIESAGENVQAIKVRRVEGVPDEYEVVYGRRRLRACRDLGLRVNAIIEQLDDVQLFIEADRENRKRADLTPWEQGAMYKHALDAGLFSSQRQMAAKLGVSSGNLSVAIQLASLPEEVVAAFPSPLDLQFRWGGALTAALERDAVRVGQLAREIAAREVRPTAKEVFTLLTSPPGAAREAASKELRSAGKKVGVWTRDGRGGFSFKVKSGTLKASEERALTDFLDKLFG